MEMGWNGARVVRSLALALGCIVGPASLASAQCVGDCNGNGVVSISELITAVNIALGNRALDDCRNADGNGNGAIGINELIQAVKNATSGCEPTPTPQATSTATATATMAEPTATPTTPVGPEITLFALTAADDSLIPPTGEEDGVPVYQLQFGSFFRIIVEAGRGASDIPPARDTFQSDSAPSFQIQANRPLGDGSLQVCDADGPFPGGIPAIDPPSFEPTEMIVDALNDLGCRFPDGLPNPSPAGRGCSPQEACLRFDDGTFGCETEEDGAEVQYCSQIISMIEEFPDGDTLLTARVLETRVTGRQPMPGPIEQIIVRVVPAFP
jgi:hypothetical protein